MTPFPLSGEAIKGGHSCSQTDSTSPPPAPLGHNFSRVIAGGSFKLSGYTPEDKMPPSRITSLRAKMLDPSSVKLTWLGAGDDYHTGKASNYMIRYSKDKIDSHEKFSQATLEKLISSPKDPHKYEETEITCPEEGATYFFALVAVDEAGNRSPLSNQVKVNLAMAPSSQVDPQEDLNEDPNEDLKNPTQKKSGGCNLIR